jgi:outer membrane autotransporter barrel domain-containing protein
MKKIKNRFHRSHDMKAMKFGVTALAVLCSAPALSADWAELSTNIENGSIAQKFHYYSGEGKQAELNPMNIQQHALTGNIIGAISDNDFSENTDINGFTLTIKDTPLTKKRAVFSAGSHSGNVTQNTLNLNKVTEGFDLNVRGGHSYKGTAKGNRLNITDSTIDTALGGSSRNGVADENSVNIVNSEVRVIHGGRTWFSKQGAKNNSVEISGAVASWVYGGESQGGEVSGNKVTIKSNGDKKSLSRGVIGGKSASSTKANVNNNEVTLIGSDVESSNESDSGVYGGFAAYGNANNNKVTIKSESNKQAIINANVFGATNEGQNTFGGPISTANGNEVNITGAIVKGDIYIAKSAGSNTSYGKLVINGDKHYRAQVESVYGGYTLSGEASHNNLNIANTDVKGDVYGGYINDGYNKQAAQNTITLDNTNVGGNVYGGYNKGTESHTTNNVITLKNQVKIDGELAGGMAESDSYGSGGFGGGFGSGFRSGLLSISGLNTTGTGTNNTINSDVTSGNTLNVYSNNVTVKNIKNFSAYNFYLPSHAQANSSILTTTGNEDIDLRNSQISMQLNAGALNLKVGESINLIKSNNAKVLTESSIQKHVMESGLIGNYGFNINSDNTALKATLISKTANANAKTALNAAHLSTELVGQLWDVTRDAIDNTNMNEQKSMTAFASANGFKSNNDNSDTDMKGAILSAGLAMKVRNHVYGGFIENGHGHYHSYQTNITFDGKIRTYGVGAFARFNVSQNVYFDGVVRAGRNKTLNNGTNGFNYRLDMPYYSAGIAIGHQLSFDHISLDNSLAYVYSRMGSDSAEIKGTTVQFAHINANRLKAQTKLSYLTGNFQPFVKLKFDYKLNGASKITAQPDEEGFQQASKGGSVGGEIGFKYHFTPAAKASLSFGHMTGKREETNGKLEFTYQF